MNEIAVRTPAGLLWRSWDENWQLAGTWVSERGKPDGLLLIEGGGVTVDWPNGMRKSWRVYGWRLVEEIDLLKVVTVPDNPYLGGTP